MIEERCSMWMGVKICLSLALSIDVMCVNFMRTHLSKDIKFSCLFLFHIHMIPLLPIFQWKWNSILQSEQLIIQKCFNHKWDLVRKQEFFFYSFVKGLIDIIDRVNVWHLTFFFYYSLQKHILLPRVCYKVSNLNGEKLILFYFRFFFTFCAVYVSH